MTLFERIASGEIPAKIVFQEDDLLVFHDASPQAPIHLLIVPKRPIPRLAEAQNHDGPLLGRLLLAAAKAAEMMGVSTSGYRLVINNGLDAGESVPHLHMHLLAGRKLAWPPG